MAVAHDFNCPPGFEPEVLDDPSQITADLGDENIELWMIKAPLNFDISLLSGHGLKEHFNIPLRKKSDIEFVAKATENHPMCKTMQTIFPHKTRSKLTVGPSFKGYVDIVQSVKIPRCDYPELPLQKPYQIPSNLKQRYIPYGSHSPPRISSPQIVKEKSKKRKRSKSLSLSVPDFDASQVSQIDLDASQVSQVDAEEPPLKKKRKKHKNKKDLGESLMADDSCLTLPPQTSVETPKPNVSHTVNSIDAEEPTPVSEKKKKKKRNKDKINGSLLESVSDPLMNVPLQNCIMDENMGEPFSPVVGSGKKKLKKKSGNLNLSTFVNNEDPSLDMLSDSIVDEILSESVVPVTKSKKKQGRKSADLNWSSVIDKNAIPESSYLDDHDEPLTKSDKKKKRKSKGETKEEKKIEDDSFNRTALSILDDSASQTPNTESSSRKKHKSEKSKKKIDDFNLSVLDESVSQTPNGESSKKKKKKHKRDKDKDESKIESVSQTPNGESSKKKKKKHKRDKDKDESKIEDDDHNTTAIISFDDVANQTPNIESSSKKKKKKKHKDEKEEERIEDDDRNETTISCLDDSTSQKANMNSSSKKSKKRKLSEGYENAAPVMNGLSTNTVEELAKKDSGIGSLEMESTHLNSVDSVLEQSVTSSHKKKKKKHKHSLDDTYLQLNIPT